MLSKTITSLLFACVALSVSVSAHGRMSKPSIVFSGLYPDSPDDQIDGYKALPPPSGLSYSGSPETNTKAFTTAFVASAYPTLRAFVLAHQSKDVKACGSTTVKGVARQPLPDKVEFSFRAGEGFVSDHQGPCEVWCGNTTRVFHNDNCAKNFREGPALLPYDKKACDASGADVLTFYWLAQHLPKWQLYINCAAIQTTGRAADAGAGANTAGESDTRPVTRQPETPPPASNATAKTTPTPSNKCRVRAAAE